MGTVFGGQKNDGRWRKGQSGNPSGRPHGARNKASMAAEALLDGQAEQLMSSCINRALAGDGLALRLCIERILPPRKDRFLHVTLPKLKTTTDLLKASTEIIDAMATGTVLPSEGQALAGVIEQAKEIMELHDIEKRLALVEQMSKGSP